MKTKPKPKRTYERGYRDALSHVLAHIRALDEDSTYVSKSALIAWLLRADDRYNERGKRGPGH